MQKLDFKVFMFQVSYGFFPVPAYKNALVYRFLPYFIFVLAAISLLPMFTVVKNLLVETETEIKVRFKDVNVSLRLNLLTFRPT